jgi:hypothetical protein
MAEPGGMIVPKVRMIGFIIPDIVVEENARDELTITQHPVERGAAIADHAFVMPSRVEMRCGFSDSGNGDGYSEQVYEELLSLQRQREPFDLLTGKRAYNDMLIRGLSQMTDEKTETSLFITVSLEKVILVSTESTSSGDQSMPEKTASSTNIGSIQTQGAGNWNVGGGVGIGSVGTIGGGGSLNWGTGGGVSP